ncbi:probable apyrase 7 isoform X1 [Arachis stenosperma]|uniref:probable apyrase 7 isoform X1 n=1 Tax=Arachis stenosperma TaxID=217475 RepID=UPI0025AD14D8|nr:probable apyrase 7 isoform X1 [Arachis stenosperma]XP_057758404.1 probable apyrase 7 isoform X1 [Arachis stenosperma]
MIFSKITAILSTLLHTQNSSSSAYPLSLPFAATKNNNLRVSSSLQDFSSYPQFGPERGHVADDVTGVVLPTHLKQPLHKVKPVQSVANCSRKKWVSAIKLAIFLTLFLFIVYMVLVIAYSYWSQGSGKYFVVIDCGSTGNRIYVYHASIQHKKYNSLPIVIKSLRSGLQKKPRSQSGRAYDRMETEPGLDKLVNNVTGLKGALKPLIRWAQKQIPAHAHRGTSVFLYATAGVRRLPSTDSKWLLDNAWSVLKQSPFLCKKDWVKTISGTEEAYFGWISLNYYSGILGVRPRKATYGALDLGGSSLQVTFESDQQLNNETSLYVRMGSVSHHLTAYSLPGYGLNEAFGKSVAHLFKREFGSSANAGIANENRELKHPCLQAGYKEQYFCPRCSFGNKGGGNPVGNQKQLGKIGASGTSVVLVGAPNWQECNALAKIAVNLSEWSNIGAALDCGVQPCALRKNLPRPYGHFYVISGFYVVYRFFNLSSEATLDDVVEKGRTFCGKKWDVAKKSVAPQPFIEQYCFRAPYIASLLREGLRITDDQISVGSGSITWTLGVALLEAGKAYSTGFGFRGLELLPMKINPLILFLILLLSLIILLCALSCVGNSIPRFFRRKYLPIFRHSNVSSASVLNIPSPFQFQRWSPINSVVYAYASSGDGRIKMPLSPTVACSQGSPFGVGHGLGDDGGGIQLMESSLYPSASSFSHSFSSTSLGQMQFDSNTMGAFWSPHRTQMRLQSRRSQSREDLDSSVAEAHLVKV